MDVQALNLLQQQLDGIRKLQEILRVWADKYPIAKPDIMKGIDGLSMIQEGFELDKQAIIASSSRGRQAKMETLAILTDRQTAEKDSSTERQRAVKTLARKVNAIIQAPDKLWDKHSRGHEDVPLNELEKRVLEHQRKLAKEARDLCQTYNLPVPKLATEKGIIEYSQKGWHKSHEWIHENT